MFRNLNSGQVLALAEMVAYQPGQVVSRTIAQGGGTGVTLFAFSQGEGLSTHSASGDALVYILDGAATVSLRDEPFSLKTGDAILLPANVPHAVQADQPFKMLLILIKDE